jgi:hypothetical protein
MGGAIKQCEFCQKELTEEEIAVSSLSKAIAQTGGMPVLFDLACKGCCLFGAVHGHEALLARRVYTSH